MAVKFCPNCNQRYIISWDTTDYVHECNSGNPAVDQEDILVVGDWVDYTGSGVIPAQEVLRQGNYNELQGTRADIEDGENKEEESPRGVRTSTHRQRQHLEFINIKKERLD